MPQTILARMVAPMMKEAWKGKRVPITMVATAATNVSRIQPALLLATSADGVRPRRRPGSRKTQLGWSRHLRRPMASMTAARGRVNHSRVVAAAPMTKAAFAIADRKPATRRGVASSRLHAVCD